MKKPLQPHLLKRVPPACKGERTMRWRGRPPIGGQDSDRVSHRCSAPYTLLPLRGISPQGETRDMERKTGESYTSCTIPVCPPLVAGATTLPGGKHVTGFSVAYGSLRIQFLCHPRKRGHYNPCLLQSRIWGDCLAVLYCPTAQRGEGGAVRHQGGGSHRRWLIIWVSCYMIHKANPVTLTL